ncbi:hypothetical protein [Saccharothrix sp.]|uniref:hypothetical protein n=1 Tax=Saccharothrix sp. TaxID=1873460 RepID=UPI002811985C|nr:hypothetical protein [Saccharothrix sp.]
MRTRTALGTCPSPLWTTRSARPRSPQGARWEVRYRNEDGRRTTKRFERRAWAAQFDADQAAAWRAPLYVPEILDARSA